MKKFCFLALMSLIVLAACGEDDSGEEASDASAEMETVSFDSESISAEAVWDAYVETGTYEAWSYWPDHEGMQEGSSPHGAYHAVYISDEISSALPIEDSMVSDNGVIVKENYTADKELAAYTLMVKVDGYNPDGNDWFWAKYSATGEVQKSGAVQGCIDCHAAQSDNDYVMLYTLAE